MRDGDCDLCETFVSLVVKIKWQNGKRWQLSEYFYNFDKAISSLNDNFMIRQKSLLFCILMLLSFSSYCQEYFSKRYSLFPNGDLNLGTSIAEHQTGYTILFYGTIQNSYNYIIGLYKIDTQGSLIDEIKIFTDSLDSFSTWEPYTLIKYQSGYIVAATRIHYLPNGRYDKGWLLRLDEDLDTLWTRYYTDEAPHDTNIMLRSVEYIEGFGYVLSAVRSQSNGSGTSFMGLLVTDTNGNLKWQKRYGRGLLCGLQYNYYYQPLNAIRTSDKGFVISGNWFELGTKIDPLIVKTDSTGNYLWQLKLGNPVCDDEYASVQLAPDSNIIIGTHYSESCVNDYYARINLLKITNEKNIIWDNKFGFARRFLRTNSIAILPNGDIAATGFHYISNAGPMGVSWLLLTDSSGNEKWYREYSLLTGDNSLNYLYHVIPANDNGFAICGEVIPAPPDTGDQDPWVIKVDSMGCTNPGECWVGIDEIQVKTFTPDKPYVVFPNPAKDHLTVEFHENPDGAVITLTDQTGKTVVTTTIDPQQERKEIDVSSLKNGLYLISVRSTSRVFRADKVVVQR